MKRLPLIILTMMTIVNLYVLGTINTNTKAINQGKRFTYDDGIALHTLCPLESYTAEDVYEMYGDKETDYKQYLLDNLN